MDKLARVRWGKLVSLLEKVGTGEVHLLALRDGNNSTSIIYESVSGLYAGYVESKQLKDEVFLALNPWADGSTLHQGPIRNTKRQVDTAFRNAAEVIKDATSQGK